MAFEETEQASGHLVRLFPTIRIATIAEAETRATAALLSMLRAVSEFGRAIVKLAGGPAGKIECYTEVPLVDHSQTPPMSLRPDGMLVISGRNGKRWRCFVELKVGSNPIERLQMDNYLRLARQEGIDALITISNEAALGSLGVNKAQSKVDCLHLSWDRLLSEARLLQGQNGVDDSDQKWMLSEWIRYVSDPQSRIIDPPTLGQHFGDLLTAAREGSIAAAGPAVRDVCDHWDGFLNKASHRLRADLGVDVHPLLTQAEKQNRELRIAHLQSAVTSETRLTGALKVKNAASEIYVDILLPARAVRFGIEVKAPTEGRQLTRVRWMVKQLSKAPPSARIQIQWENKKVKSQARVSELDSELRCLLRDLQGQLIPSDLHPKTFTIEWTQDLAKPKGRSTAAILEGVMADLEKFYSLVVEGVTAFVPAAPKLPLAATAESTETAPLVQPTAPTSENVDPPSDGEVPVSEVVSVRAPERSEAAECRANGDPSPAEEAPPERPSGFPDHAAQG